MKINITYFAVLSFILMASCSKLNLNPLSEGSSENWYSTETELEMAINDLFKEVFWERPNDLWTDDLTFRGEVSSTDNISEMVASTLNAENSTIESLWLNNYKAISRAIKVIENLDRVTETVVESKRTRYEAIARFVRASMYARLIQHWGDVPFYLNNPTLDEAQQMERTDKAEILQAIYADYDFAAQELPVTYGASENQYPTKGAALAMKARIALYMADYQTAKTAAQSVIDLDQYTLTSDFRSQFVSSSKNTAESIFLIPRSVELGKYVSDTRYYYPRNQGGFGSRNPTYSLFSAFLCSDGLPIDQSPLYDPQSPWENRDPRFNETFVEHGEAWLGFVFQPHPDSLTVLNLTTGRHVTNLDTRANVIHAPFNGLVMKKGINEDYSDDRMADPDFVIIRYADVLLMYAEAKIELNELDQSVVDAINKVRARAYKVDHTDVLSYPAVTLGGQAEMRKDLRFERRMELAFEGLRYMDLMRWRLAEQVLNTPIYGMLDVPELRARVVNQGLWFFPGIPSVDDNSLVDLSAIADQGLIKLYALRRFDPEKNYLWPIPAKDVLMNPHIRQNPNY